MVKDGDSPGRRKRRWTPWKIFFLAFSLLVLLAVLLATFAAVRFRVLANRRIEAQLAAIREAGEPTTPEELEEHYRLPPDAEDTTDLWMKAVRLLDTPAYGSDAEGMPYVGRSDPGMPPPGQPWEELEAVEEFLRKYRVSLELMHQAAEAGGAARYPTDFYQGLRVPLEHAQQFREGARLLKLEARARGHRGDAAGAARSIRAILMLARSLQREPVLVSMLVRIACETIALTELEDLLDTVDFSEQDLIELQQDLRAGDYEEHLHQAMLGQRVLGVMGIEDPATLDFDGPPPGLARLSRQDGLAFYLEQMAELAAATQRPWPQALHDSDQAEQRIDQIIDGSIVTKIRYWIPALLAPAWSASFQATARIRATSDAVDTGIAIERYRREHGKLPEKLDELVPEFLPRVPIDPYDGQPLRYVDDDEGCRVYSIGMNRTDEGGVGDLLGHPEEDVVFRLDLSGGAAKK